ncbi:MAG: hypothetical protein QOD77_523 [Thermoplasmata archaeon]|nr:hypothetical protein [Thermoplasmata archaeon]
MDACDALASPTRIALLRQLRIPQSLANIEVRPAEGGERNIARQVVRRHLDRLMEAGLVRSRPGPTPRSLEFVLDNQAIYAVAEGLLDLARLRPAVEPSAPTILASPPSRPVHEGPMLLLVRGLEPGTPYPLGEPGATGGWVIGRRRSHAVALDFDPFVSSDNARLTRQGPAVAIEDIPGSRNGTTVNFRRLAPDERVVLRHGDVVGVGRSLLLYRA